MIAIWAHDEVSNTDRYVATVAPLASDPVVQEAIVQRVSSEIFNRLQIASLTKQTADALAAQGVPTRITDSLAALSTPLAESIKSFVTDKTRTLVKSPDFAAAWEEAVIDTQIPGNFRDRLTGLEHHLHGLSLELRAEFPARSRHERILSVERNCPRSLVHPSEDRGVAGPTRVFGAVSHVAPVRGGALRVPGRGHHGAGDRW